MSDRKSGLPSLSTMVPGTVFEHLQSLVFRDTDASVVRVLGAEAGEHVSLQYDSPQIAAAVERQLDRLLRLRIAQVATYMYDVASTSVLTLMHSYEREAQVNPRGPQAEFLKVLDGLNQRFLISARVLSGMPLDEADALLRRMDELLHVPEGRREPYEAPEGYRRYVDHILTRQQEKERNDLLAACHATPVLGDGAPAGATGN